MQKREVELVIISDVHLGTYGCKAKELLHYLKSIQPKTLILNGDIIDIWQFRKSYWPDAHMSVLKRIMEWVSEGIPVYYLIGNHDEILRKFADFNLGSFQLLNKMVLDLDGKKAWISHGDIFDVTLQHSKWLAKLGAIGYGILIILNRFVNWCLTLLGRDKMYFSKQIKAKFKNVLKFIGTAADLAIDKQYDYVICGHIHQPEMVEIKNARGKVLYINSGDWVESLTSVEYHQGEWKIYNYLDESFTIDFWNESNNDDLAGIPDIKTLFEQLKSEKVGNYPTSL